MACSSYVLKCWEWLARPKRKRSYMTSTVFATGEQKLEILRVNQVRRANSKFHYFNVDTDWNTQIDTDDHRQQNDIQRWHSRLPWQVGVGWEQDWPWHGGWSRGPAQRYRTTTKDRRLRLGGGWHPMQLGEFMWVQRVVQLTQLVLFSLVWACKILWHCHGWEIKMGRWSEHEWTKCVWLKVGNAMWVLIIFECWPFLQGPRMV